MLSDDEFVIRCAECHAPITRAAEVSLGEPWVHTDDEVVMNRDTMRITSLSRYNHEATPDVIDLEKKSPDSLVSDERPWYVAIRPIEAVAREIEPPRIIENNTHNTDTGE